MTRNKHIANGDCGKCASPARSSRVNVDDERWMRRALEEAAKGTGRTAPNPSVGAVIVKGGHELGAGWHHRAGQPHAEREALAAVRRSHGSEALRGATIYVTLEPCSTCGRTPPCTDGLIEAGVARVVYGARDPNPAHAGRADQILRAAGIEVGHGVLEEACAWHIRGFAMVHTQGRPWVIWKTAMSLDARLTRPPGEGQWLTGTVARQRVQVMRAACEAIITSGETVRRDRPRLTVRDPALLAERVPPLRLVATDHPDSLPAAAPLFTDEIRHRTRIVPASDPAGLLRKLAREDGVTTVLLECGGRMAGAWMDARLIDEVAIFLAPLLCGGMVLSLAGVGNPAGWPLVRTNWERLGSDLLLTGALRQG